MLAIQLLAGEIPSLPPTRCVVIGLFLLVACWSPATLQPSGHPRVAGIFCGLAAFFFFFSVFQPATPPFGFACTCACTGKGSAAGGGEPGLRAPAGSVGVHPRLAPTVGEPGGRGPEEERCLLGAGHRPQPGQPLTHLSQQWLFIGLSPK